MAKQVNSYNKAPWDFKKGGIDQFILVSGDNRRNAIVIGRILYFIAKNGSSYQFCGTISVDPCFTSGWIKYPFKPWDSGFPGHQKVFMSEGMDYNKWKKDNDTIITTAINKKELYINPTDQLLTYYKE